MSTRSTQEELWDYAVAVFSLPPLRLQAVAKTIGLANLAAISVSATEAWVEAANTLQKIEAAVNTLSSDKHQSHLYVEEVRAEGARASLIKKNMFAVNELLANLMAAASERKFVLPQCRSVNHFSIGDEIMLYVNAATDVRKIVEYDWVSGKMLCPGWEMHCHSNTAWAQGGKNSGHYFRTTNQHHLFKRRDFYDLRKMLGQGEDEEFTNLLPRGLAEKILKGSVEPLTDEQLAANQESYIRTATAVVTFCAQNVPLIAEQCGMTA